MSAQPVPLPDARRAEEILARTTAAALAVSSVEGATLFADLARRLAEILEVDATLIAVFSDPSRKRLHTLGAWLDGRSLRNFEYELELTPCRAVVGRSSRFVASGVHGEFAPGTLFAAKGFDSYAAHSLLSSDGTQLGMVVALDRAPMADQALTEALLKIFAARAAAEVERSQAEQSYRAIFAAAEDAIFVHDWDTGRILDVSPKASELYGYPPEVLKTMRVGDFSANVPPYTEADALAHIEQAKAQDQPLRFEWRGRHRDGTLRWHEVTLKRAQIGGQRRVLASVRDITERKAAADALQLREQQYRAIFDGSADAMVLWSAELTLVDINRAFTRMFGYDHDEVVGTGYGEIIPTAGLQARREGVELALAGRESQLEIEVMHKDGRRFEVELRYLPIRHLGKPHALAIARDITQRKAAEAALRASEAQHRAIFEASTDALQLIDGEHRVVDVNPAYERMYDKRRDEVVGKTISELVREPFRAERQALVNRALAGEAAELLTTGYRKDGTSFDLEVRCIPFEHHGRRHVLGIARDITERKRVELALRASEEQYRAIFNVSADALMLWDSQLKRVDVNPAHEKIFGYSRHEVVGRGFEGLDYPPEFAEPRLESVRRALAGEASQVELEALRKGGERIVTELRTIPFQHLGEPHVLQIARDITERKRAEAALSASEAQYRAIFDASDDALILWNSQYQRVDVNPAYERLFGWTRDEVVGRSFDVFSTDPDYVRPRRELVTRALAGETCRAELEYVRKDGRRIHTEIHTIPFSHRGQPHVLAISRDITERKRAEDALRASEARYRLLFDTESDAIVLVDAHSLRLLDVNPAAVQLYGYSRDELLAMTAADLSVEPEATRLAVQQGEGATRIGLRLHRRRDGSVFPVEINANRLLLEGRLTVVAAIRDISERREREEAVRRSEARLRATVETALDCVIGMDRQGRIIEFNAAAERCFGYRREQVLGRVLADTIVPQRHRQAHADGMALHLRTGRGRYIGQRVETSALRADGTEFPIELTIAEAESAEGTIYIGYLRDLTDARRAEQQRQQLETQLRQAQKMEAIGQLAGGLAHDFNNILTSILGYIVMAQERATDQADVRSVAHLDHATAGCRRARDLVQQLLTFARGQRSQPEPLDLCRLVRESVPLLRASVPSSIALEYDCGEGLPPALADRVQIDQVLLNLVLNGRDALAAAKGARGCISVAVAERTVDAVCSSCRQPARGRFVELSVRDDGPGMSAAVLERVFEPFFSTKPPGPHSGMGLAMVHGIVHEHRGHVVLETAAGAGVLFRVLLPPAQQPAAGPPPGAAVERSSRSPLRGRVLVVDDEASVRSLLHELLESWGLQVEAVSDGEAAFARLQGERFDLVLTDQTMPGLDGLGLAHRIATLPQPPPVLLMSGLATVMQVEPSAAGVRELLAKPLEAGPLRAALHRHLAADAPT